MRIERMEIDGFGRFHDSSWPLEDGLTVLLGPNEAGKTTLLNALRALLFGFEASRDGRPWYPALAGGRRGGRLVLRTAAGERWTVERHGERGGGGALAVRAPNGNQGGQETLDRLLHGADRDLFNSIFAFGLTELQTFASLSAEGVRGRIYGAGAGLGGTSAIDLERRLRAQLDAAFLPRGSQRPLNQLLTRIEETRRAIAQLARQPEEHAAAHRERDGLLARVASLHADAAATRERLLRLRHLREARPIAAELAELEAELDGGDPALDEVTDDAATTLDALLAAAAEARAVLATIDEQLTEAGAERAAITIDEGAIAAADEIAALSRARGAREASAARRRDLLAAAARQEVVIAEQAARAGGWAEARLVTLDDSISTLEATRDHEAALARARTLHAEAAARRRTTLDELAALDAGDAAREDQAPSAESLDDRLAALRELAALPVAAPAPSYPAPWVWGRAAVLLALGLAVAATLVGAAAGYPLLGAVLGSAVGVLAIAARLALGRRGAPPGRPQDGRRAELLERAGLPATADAAAVAAAWEDALAVRARHAVAEEERGRLESRRAELARRDRALEAAAEAVTAAEDAWRDWLRRHALPDDASPEAARQLLAAAGMARRAADERDHHRREAAALEAAEAAFRERVDHLCRRLGVPVGTEDASREARIAGIAERLDHARADARRARELDERLKRLEATRARAARGSEERDAAVAAHLAAVGCPDADVLRRRSAVARARRALRVEIRERRARLGGLAGDLSGVDALVAEVRALEPAALEAREIEAREALERLETEERDANNRIGALDARIRELEATEQLGLLRQELAGLEGRAAALARDWAVRALALRLLEETRARYERERQPDVIRAAESHFTRITGGRYTRIVAPPGDSSVRVETEGGESRGLDELSRGTAEQLYLALRFGLVEEFARNAEPLPIVMDDILVNFDADRAARAAAAIGQLARRHQVVYFTCHPWTTELLDPGAQRTLGLD